MNGKYLDIWKSVEDVRGDYPDAPQDDKDIVFAAYSYEDYSGYAIVVFIKDGALFENHDCHCSCNGLEVWAPQATTLEALRIRREWQPDLGAALDAFFGVATDGEASNDGSPK